MAETLRSADKIQNVQEETKRQLPKITIQKTGARMCESTVAGLATVLRDISIGSGVNGVNQKAADEINKGTPKETYSNLAGNFRLALEGVATEKGVYKKA